MTIEEPKALFSLRLLFDKQQELIDKIKSDKPDFWEKPEKFEGERIFRLCSFLIHEAVELQQETKWKHWKAPENYKIDYENRKVEIADLWHVLIQLSMECGMNADDVIKAFLDKHEENKDRQVRRY